MRRGNNGLFKLMCRLEPKLLSLYTTVTSMQDDGHSPYYCANEVWNYAEKILGELIGYDRAITSTTSLIDESYLRSSDAYEVARQVLYACLSNCRNCSCMAGLKAFSEVFGLKK